MTKLRMLMLPATIREYGEMNDEEILEAQRQIANALVKRLNDTPKPGAVTEAIATLLRRIIGAGDSLAVLQQHSPHECAFDGAMILRGIYDATLQALYILAEPTKRDERAQNYLDFYWVERVVAIDLYDKNGTDLANRIKRSPKRAQGEVAIEQQFQRVRSKFLDEKSRLRKVWYKGNLRSLAREVGLEAEYELLQRQLSGVVHASPLSLKDGPHYRGFLLRDLAWRFSFRVLGRFAEFNELALNETEVQIISHSHTNVFNLT